MFGMFGASSLYQREVVEAYGRKWLVCLVLEQSSGELDALADRYALAVPCEGDEGRVDLPATASLIQFTPAHVKEARDRRAACVAADHPLVSAKRVSLDNAEERCACGERKSTRPLDAEERKDVHEGLFTTFAKIKQPGDKGTP